MNWYIYRADIYCEECGEKIKALLGFVLEGLPEHLFDSDEYPKGPFDVSAADYPHHCGACGLFLENPLTDEGRDYTLELINDYIETGNGNPEVLREWAIFYNMKGGTK